jgi:hypothetical protein
MNMKTRNIIISGVLYVMLVASWYTLKAADRQDHYGSWSRYDYYTTEESAEIIVWVPASRREMALHVDLVFEFSHLVRQAPVRPGMINLLKVPLAVFHEGENEITVSYYENEKWVGSEKIGLRLLAHHYNAVKIDRASGGLVVEGLPFFPFGFYTYSPVHPLLAEQEVVRGFNLISPYQQNERNSIRERRAYMDRCAALGMKVNYHLTSLAGGGGVYEKAYLTKGRRDKLLQKEIEAFRDHPALLSWYIADEPAGQGIPPGELLPVYKMIKELDPYHPVTMVFMHAGMAVEYSDVTDIVMTDPYPVPHGDIREVGASTAMLHDVFFPEKPVWIVPQAFGGNEYWEREPTRQELRAMTYLAIVNNAMGVQYFIRQGPNVFPKSTIAWNECGAMALEVAEITPYLFSPDPVPEIVCEREDISIKGFHKDGSFMILVVNTLNEPQEFSLSVDGLRYNGSASVLFENRRVPVMEGRIDDVIDAYGTRIYRIRYRMPASRGPSVHPKNLLKDPSFEDITGTGIPASCYAVAGNDQGATYFIDPRVAVRGEHALRLNTPAGGDGVSLSFHQLRIEPGHSYTMSVQARALPLKYRKSGSRNFLQGLFGSKEDEYPDFTLSFGTNCRSTFTPGSEWKEYSFSCLPQAETGANRLSPSLESGSMGTIWFDLLQLYPDMEMRSYVNRDNNEVALHIVTSHRGADIRYTTDGSVPGQGSTQYVKPFRINSSATVKAVALLDNEKAGYIERYFEVHLATGRYVEYRNKYSSKYKAGHNDGLVDGILATNDHLDGKWQGFEGDDLDVLINLKEIKTLREIELRFLSDAASWIFLPESITIFVSEDGVSYEEFRRSDSPPPFTAIDPDIYRYIFSCDGIQVRYVRVVAGNRGVCPEGHPGAGEKAWLFTDEVIIR